MSHFKDAQIAYGEALKFILCKNWKEAKLLFIACNESLKKCLEEKNPQNDYSSAEFLRIFIGSKLYMSAVCTEMNQPHEAAQYFNEGALHGQSAQGEFICAEIYISIANSEASKFFSAIALMRSTFDLALRVFENYIKQETDVARKKFLTHKIIDAAILLGENEILANNDLWVISKMSGFISMVDSMPEKEAQDYCLYNRAYNILARSCMRLSYLRAGQLFQLAEKCFSSIPSSNELRNIIFEFTSFPWIEFELICSEEDRFLASSILLLMKILQSECGKPNFPNVQLNNFILSMEGKTLLTAICSKIAAITHQYMVHQVQAGVDIPVNKLRELVLDLNVKNAILSDKLHKVQQARHELSEECLKRGEALKKIELENERLIMENEGLRNGEKPSKKKSRTTSRYTKKQEFPPFDPSNQSGILPAFSSLGQFFQPSHLSQPVFRPTITIPAIPYPDFQSIIRGQVLSTGTQSNIVSTAVNSTCLSERVEGAGAVSGIEPPQPR